MAAVWEDLEVLRRPLQQEVSPSEHPPLRQLLPPLELLLVGLSDSPPLRGPSASPPQAHSGNQPPLARLASLLQLVASASPLLGALVSQQPLADSVEVLSVNPQLLLPLSEAPEGLARRPLSPRELSASDLHPEEASVAADSARRLLQRPVGLVDSDKRPLPLPALHQLPVALEVSEVLWVASAPPRQPPAV